MLMICKIFICGNLYFNDPNSLCLNLGNPEVDSRGNKKDENNTVKIEISF